MFKKFLLIFICFLFLPLFRIVAAQEYKTDYQVEYFLDNSNGDSNTNVKFNITVTNLSNEVYVKKLSIVYPFSFTTSSIKAADDEGPVVPQVTSDSQNSKITLEFTNPQTGKNSVNHFKLDFKQEKLFNNNESTWELIIPTFEYKKGDSYTILVDLPQDKLKKISITKPAPTSISNNQITWINPQSKTIYAVFGDTQYYKVDLTYHLKNTRLIPVLTELALPPDTLYQKILVDKIDPSPISVYQDNDQNYLARYFLAPSQGKTVTFTGYVTVSSNPRKDYLQTLPDQIKIQEDYLTTPLKYWKPPDTPQFNNIKTVEEIFSSTTNTLVYDYSRKPGENTRYGAENILSALNKAVCVEFSDLFIALARKAGIPAREIEGYGFSHDPRIRPLSLISDVLHSWPEYFDRQKRLWVPVDPTWQNTSGIDYFTSFDFNHIAFVIHSKQSDYPIAAGLYKFENSKDVSIKPLSTIPPERSQLLVAPKSIPNKMVSGQRYSLHFSIKNMGNVYIYNKVLQIHSRLLQFVPNNLKIDLLAPLEEKDIIVSSQTLDNKINSADKISVEADGKELFSNEVKLVPFYYQYAALALYLGGAILLVLLSTVIYTKFSKKRQSP